ncbi:sugar phosphate isomerase/epimerase and 4-hydroxyphenylpyruvate domain-containing protein [Zhihengliuella halotolerans]|uniref:sugar phosphate isomerase/epimerase and 4-hydroxyphenylpyruvate domain-containing protein n=1 Tax=Zhihengliuella halotolerans TaxID=370736 RepID=UPI000C7FF160|nr:sugar phosphate isomerase/epimerase and 4-hydroxyphenylpyruvate domain-containing protein [Zhihengliuella halotolerans]
MRTSIATVCLSGSLEEKMSACAQAGFDGIEVFEPDLVASDLTPEEIRARAERLGLSLDLYQPFRDFEGVTEELLEANLRRAEARFRVMNRLGIDTILVCSNVATATIDSDEVSAAQLRRLGDLAAGYGVRVAFEALAWGRYVNDYRRAWRIVQLADHPHIGTCLDSFHILSRGHDPAGIEEIDGEKIFFLQLADAPELSMDVLSWSRHHRLFPGEGEFDLAAFLAHVLRTGYDGAVSLEVFNDTFRQTASGTTAVQAHRSLYTLADETARRFPDAAPSSSVAPVQAPAGIDFVEVQAEDTREVEEALEQLGFVFRGQHRTKPVRLWSAGGARIVLNEQYARGDEPHLSGLGLLYADVERAERRISDLDVPRMPRPMQAGEQRLPAFATPHGPQLFLAAAPADGAEPGWVGEFEHGYAPDASNHLSAFDHVNLVSSWETHDETVHFYGSVLGFEKGPVNQVASPHGLVRSRVLRTHDGTVRLPFNVLPAVHEEKTEHVALVSDNVMAVAHQARNRGMRFLPVPANYYDDVRARFDLDDRYVDLLRSHQVLYDRDEFGEFLHFYTRRIGGVFFEVVQRIGGYDGYGADNAPVRLAAQSRLDGARRER